MRLASVLALAAVASLGVESHVSVAPRRRCAWCKSPSNRCPCAVCGACTTDGGAPGAVCGCGRGRKDDGAGEGERSPRGPTGSPVPLTTYGRHPVHGVGICNPDDRTPLTDDQVAAGAWPGPTGPFDDGGRSV